MNIEEKAAGIIEQCLQEKSTNPYEIFHKVAASEFVSIHGPEHHILDGACILTAYANAGGKLDLKLALNRLAVEGMKMPGAICGCWGVCGAVLSVGCALAIIDGTGPLSEDGTWGSHMECSAKAVAAIAATYGPRCCKRDGMLALAAGIDYINEHKQVQLGKDGANCSYSEKNAQCIREKCLFYNKRA